MSTDSPPSVAAWEAPPIVKEIARNSAVVAINLVKFEGQVQDLRAGDLIDTLGMQFKLGAARPPEPNYFSAFVGIDLDCRAKNEPARSVATISCAYAAKYIVKDSELFCRLTDDDFVSFASINGVLTLWPYLREFSNTAAQRMMLPPVLLPFLQGVFNPAEILKKAQRIDKL